MNDKIEEQLKELERIDEELKKVKRRYENNE